MAKKVSLTKDGRRGGLLHGPTDKDGGKGIPATVVGGNNVLLGGGEVIINEEAVNQNCELLNEINTSTGGRPIPCGLQNKANTGKFEEGGKVTPEQVAIDALNSLTTSDIYEIKNQFNQILNESIIEEEKKLNNFLFQKKAYETEREELWEKEKTLQYGEEKQAIFKRRSALYELIQAIDRHVTNQRNIVTAIKNGGGLISFTDKKGLEHKDIPSFVKINTGAIDFDIETILVSKNPVYIPHIDENIFRRKGFVFDAIRITTDTYLMATNGYEETLQKRLDRSDEHPKDYDQGYILVTLDQLALINDYYFTRARALNIKEAEEKNKKNEAYYDSLPKEKRESHLNQKNFYATLPVNVKKKISQEDYDLLDLDGKEKLYKPFKRYGSKRLTSKLGDNSMWVSFHLMYERFVNPEARPIKKDKTVITEGANRYGTFGNPETFQYWYWFRDMMNWKIKDIKIQRESLSETRKLAVETSFGESNTDDQLKEKYGILVKRQDGSKINPGEIDQIKNGWLKVQITFGGLIPHAKTDNLKISHTGTKYVFASKAAGMYLPQMKTIAVSNKFGDNQFNSILAHEVAHWIDNTLGVKLGRRYATDDFECTAGVIARDFRKSMNKKSDSDYINSTKECFARAFEQFFAITNYGDQATLIYTNNTDLGGFRSYFTEESYVNKETYNNTIYPLIKQFLKEQEEFFKYDVEIENSTSEIIKNTEQMKTETFDPIIGRTVHPSNMPEFIGVVGHKTDGEYYVKFNDGSDAYFPEDKLIIISDPEKHKFFKKGDRVIIKDVNGDYTLSGEVSKLVTQDGFQMYVVESGPDKTKATYTADEIKPNSEFLSMLETEKEHLETLEKVASHEITPEEAVAEIVETHLEEKDVQETYDQNVKHLEHWLKSDNKFVINSSVNTLSEWVEKHPSLYPQFVLKMHEIPKKFRTGVNPYDKDFGMPNVVKWLKENNINLFDLLPAKEYSMPKYKPFETKNDDNVFMGIHSDFAGDDQLRPWFTGTNFNEYGATTTNAHILLFTEYRGTPSSTFGNFCHTKKCFTWEEQVKEAKYPNWKSVIPTENTYKISLKPKYLFDFLKNCIDLQVIDRVKKMVTFHYPDSSQEKEVKTWNDYIAFNAEFMIECISAMIKLGHSNLEISFSSPNRAALIYPLGSSGKVQAFKTDFVLCTPLMADDQMVSESPAYNLETNCANFYEVEKLFCFDSDIKKEKKREKEIETLKEKISTLEKINNEKALPVEQSPVLEPSSDTEIKKPTKDVLMTRLEIVQEMYKESPSDVLQTRIEIIEAMIANPERYCCGGAIGMESGGHPSLRSIKVVYSDGTIINTSMASHLTDKEMLDYFAVGKTFNIGSGEHDKMAKVLSAEITDSKNIMKEGGAVPNNYEGKTPEQVWNKWSLEQREHFFRDHRNDFVGVEREKIRQKYLPISYNELPIGIKDELAVHVHEGQYDDGGVIESEEYKDIVKEIKSTESKRSSGQIRYRADSTLSKKFDKTYSKNKLQFYRIYIEPLNIIKKIISNLSRTKPNYKVVLEVDGIIVFEKEVWSETGAKVLAKELIEEVAFNIYNTTPYNFVKFSKGGPLPKNKKKIAKVMGELKKGTLKSSSGKKVKSKKQAVAIALSEARKK